MIITLASRLKQYFNVIISILLTWHQETQPLPPAAVSALWSVSLWLPFHLSFIQHGSLRIGERLSGDFSPDDNLAGYRTLYISAL